MNGEQTVLELFEVYRGDWLKKARGVARRLAQEGQGVTIDDVRKECPPPAGQDPRVMGAVFDRKGWRCVGYRKSDRRECHGRPIGIFVRRGMCTTS